MLKFIKNNWPQIFLSLIVAILCIRNFTPVTFLSGWDNLHPEFNIFANIKRSIFSTWQEYQGLGLLAGMAHASDLIRQLIILPLTFILPTNLIRYFWHFAMLFLGTIGTFTLSNYITKNKYSSVIASLFYLLNFASVQYFHLPFEPYSTFWGFFPWLIYNLFKYLELPNQNHFKKLFWINLLATPSFYVQTIFVVYFFCLIIILVLNHDRQKTIKIITAVILVNSFWLLPNIYFTLTKVSVTQSSFQNIMATDQFIEQNQYRGNLGSFLLLQNQYYDLKDGSKFIMETWHEHFASPLVVIIGLLFFSTIPLSLFTPNKYRNIFICILIFGLIGFLCSTFPFDTINHFFRQIPLLNQILRNSFTKLLVPTVLSISVLIGIGLSRYQKNNLLFIPLIVYFSLPSFLGNYISPKMRVLIPTEYFELSKYLASQDSSARIAELPQYNYWGWYSYSWGYVGSGFTWYGIDQPVTSRTFDVWDNHLEDYYWQLHYALIKRDPQIFNQLLEKYNISYVLYDDNLNFPEAANSGKVSLENQKLIEESDKLSLEKQFGKIKLYHFHRQPAVYSSNGDFSEQSFRPEISLSEPSEASWQECPNSESHIKAVNQETVKFINCGSTLDLNTNYVIKVIAKKNTGRPLLVKVFSIQDNRLIVDGKLLDTDQPQYIYIPKIYPFDQGLGINFSSLSVSNQPSINDLISVAIATTDTNIYDSLAIKDDAQKLSVTNVSHPNQTFYSLTMDTKSLDYLILPQSFSSDWVAFYFNCMDRPLCLPTLLPNHVLINNWANGWLSPANYTGPIYIFFWPQLLEFIGLLLIPLTFFWFTRRNRQAT